MIVSMTFGLSLFLIFIALLALVTYIWLFMFIHRASLSRFITRLLSPNGVSFLKSILSIGYMKTSFKQFLKFYYSIIFSEPTTLLGSKAIDAQVHTLSGEIKYLKQNYFDDTPLILNIGSYS